MALIVSGHERRTDPRFDAMFHDRKRVFIDKLGWELSAIDGREVDEFDTDAATYLLALEPGTQRHMASVRLLPTTRSHLMDTVFAHLCEDAIPRGPRVFEMSRLCSNPDLAPDVGALARLRLLLSLIEYAVENDIDELTAVCEIKFLSKLLAVGWDCRPLGAPQMVAGALTGALSIRVRADTLAILHDRFGFQRAA